MHILVTGGAGYIGSHTCLNLIDQGHEVTIIDDLSTGNIELIPKKAKFVECNINEKKIISNLIKKNKFDAVIHFAAFIQVEESVKNPNKYFENNTENSIKFLETCYENDLANIIFSSTAAVYGNQSGKTSILETDPIQPLNPYAESKIKIENYLFNNNNLFNFIVLRYFNVAGADPALRSGLISKKSTHLIKILSEVAIGKRDNITIYGNDYDTDDGTAIRDYIHVSDLSNIHLKSLEYLINTKQSNIFNCGYGKGYSVKEVVDRVNKITKNGIKFDYGERRPGDADILVSNVTKLNKSINWIPKYNDLNVILETSINWEKILYDKNI